MLLNDPFIVQYVDFRVEVLGIIHQLIHVSYLLMQVLDLERFGQQLALLLFFLQLGLLNFDFAPPSLQE